MIRKLVSTLLGLSMLATLVLCHQNHQEPFHQGQHPATPPPQHHQQAPNKQLNTNEHNQMMNNINKDHVLEHLDGVINKPKEQMTVEEQNFYYFKLHDYDNNNMLDGLELVSAFAHSEEHSDSSHGNHSETSTPAVPHIRISDEELAKLIDEIMREEDKNADGYITYQEFLIALKGTGH